MTVRLFGACRASASAVWAQQLLSPQNYFPPRSHPPRYSPGATQGSALSQAHLLAPPPPLLLGLESWWIHGLLRMMRGPRARLRRACPHLPRLPLIPISLHHLTLRRGRSHLFLGYHPLLS